MNNKFIDISVPIFDICFAMDDLYSFLNDSGRPVNLSNDVCTVMSGLASSSSLILVQRLPNRSSNISIFFAISPDL